MTNTHGGRRDNTKRRPDDKRGGVRIPRPGKKLGRPRKEPPMNAQIWQHRTSGEWFAVITHEGVVTSAIGPLHHSELEPVTTDDIATNSDQELADALVDDQDSYNWICNVG